MPAGISDEQISVDVVLAPDVVRRAVVEQRDEPGMHADHAIDPGDRHVALAERHLRPRSR